MTLPVDNSASSAAAAPITAQAARQQVEKVLSRLPATVEDSPEGRGRAMSREDLVPPVQQINGVLRSYGIEFEVDGEPPDPVTRLVDKETGEVLRQIPAEEVLAVAERLDEVRGLLMHGTT